MITAIKKVGMFATPEDGESFTSWVEAHPLEDRAHLYTAAYMMHNLIAQETDKLREESKSFKKLKVLLDDVKGFVNEAGTNTSYAVDLCLVDANNQGLIYQIVGDLLKEAIEDKL